jgi:thiol-disulfide isomerase/thioredoxin
VAIRVARRGLLAGGTVAVAVLGRKSWANELGDLSNLKVVQPPKPAPMFTFQDANGSPRRLSDYAGDGIVLNLWATWCAPCKQELPSLDALAGKLVGKRIGVLALSSDRGGAAAVQAYYKQRGIKNLHVLLDPEGQAVQAFEAPGIPTTYIIDRRGFERAYAEGSENWGTDAAVKRVEALVSV